MTMVQRGIYLEILIQQWIYGSFPRDPWKLCKIIGADYRTTVRFLSNYCHLAVCTQCGHSWNASSCQCGCSEKTATCHNLKLKNLRNDVVSGLDLGTTEPKREGKQEPKPEGDVPPAAATPPSGNVPSSSQEQEGIVADSESLKLAQDFWLWIDSPDYCRNCTGRWASQIESRPESVEFVRAALRYATENEFFVTGLKAVIRRKEDPVSYLLRDKFENILTSMEVAEAKQKKRREKSGKEKDVVKVESKFEQVKI